VPPVHVEIERTLRHPVEAVFGFMADPANRPRWQEHTQRVEILTEGPSGVGTRWRETTGGVGTYEAEVVAFEPGRLWVEEADTSRGRGRISVAFAPQGATASLLSVTVEIHLRGARRLMGPALAPLIARQLPRDLERLEELLGEPG
jgi:uncharacterized protein YndB with AHSA1/START domain